jgi:acid phosphatase
MARHNPWVYFTSERHLCRRYDVPLTELHRDVIAAQLPNLGMVVPNRCNDAHDCALAQADSWLEDQVGEVLDGPDWRSGRLAVVVTADEDDHSQGNKVLTVVIHPSQRHHVVTTPLTHYSLARLYEDVAGLPHLANAASAASMTSAFGLSVQHGPTPRGTR